MTGPWLFLPVVGLVAGSRSACLPNATAEIDRRDLVNVVAGESYSIGLWKTGNYAAAHLVTTVVQIVVEELLGYNTDLKGTGGIAMDAFYALMGCTNPLGNADRGCGRSLTHVHINVESWREGYLDEWAQVQAQYPNVAPRNLGNGGYSGTTAMYVPLAVQQKAYQAEGISLDFYRDYNMSWRTPGSYFSPPGDLDVSKLLPCADTVLMSTAVIGIYFDLTGDAEGVVVDSEGLVVAKCFADYFWYSPACRADPGACLTWFTGGTGWGMSEMLLKAAIFNIPLATAVASTFQGYANLPSDFNLMLYWWVPDPTFLRLKPRKIIFPEYEPEAWARGDHRSAARDLSVDKLVSWDLGLLAPEVEEFLTRFQLNLKEIDEMMLDQLDTNDVDLDVACRWLQSNEQKWKTWLPESGKCLSQFGMYSEEDETFLQTREEVKITCRACPSGFFSSQLKDTQGITFICKECPSGSFQVSGASVSCTPCPTGSYQNETGRLACNRCPVGQYQDEEGQRDCKLCPAGATTLLLGSNSILDCGCKAGSINVASVATNVTSKALECLPCHEGFDCPFSSSVQALLTGQPSSSEQLATRIESGYFASVNDPLQLFRCRPVSWCPGGMPGTCAGGLKGEPCSYCPDGKSWAGDECADCGAAALGWVAAVSLALIGLRTAYFYTNTAVTARATPFKTFQMAVGLVVNVLQSLALFGLMSAKWPQTFEMASSHLQIFVLDLEGLNLGCLFGGTSSLSYVATALICPFTLFWLTICYALSHSRCFRMWGLEQWKLPFTFNTMGLCLQLGFGTVAAVALKPMMCYKHPNGRHSVLSYPGIFCGDGEHGLLLSCGISSLIVFVVGFLVICSYAVWNLPQWSVKGEHSKVQSFRFCTANFRTDSYGFIVPLLCRGLGFAIAVVAGTNAPPVQTAVASMVLIIYLVMQTSLRPWKAPSINVADTVCTASLLTLASRSLQTDSKMEAELAEYFTSIILMLILFCLASLVLLCILGMALKFAGADWDRFLSLGRSYDSYAAMKISQSLKQCAEGLMEMEADYLCREIETMNSYDVRTILNLINVVGADLQDVNDPTSNPALATLSQRRSIMGSRVRLAALNASLTSNLDEPDESDDPPTSAPPDPRIVPAIDVPGASETSDPNDPRSDGSEASDPGTDAKSRICSHSL